MDAHGKVYPDETKQNHVASWACEVGPGEVILSQTQRALRTSLHPRAEETELASQDCGTAGVFCLSKVIKDPYALRVSCLFLASRQHVSSAAILWLLPGSLGF